MTGLVLAWPDSAWYAQVSTWLLIPTPTERHAEREDTLDELQIQGTLLINALSPHCTRRDVRLVTGGVLLNDALQGGATPRCTVQPCDQAGRRSGVIIANLGRLQAPSTHGPRGMFGGLATIPRSDPALISHAVTTHHSCTA